MWCVDNFELSEFKSSLKPVIMLELFRGKTTWRKPFEKNAIHIPGTGGGVQVGRRPEKILWAHRGWLRRVCGTLTPRKCLLILHYCSTKKMVIKSTSGTREKVRRSCGWRRLTCVLLLGHQSVRARCVPAGCSGRGCMLWDPKHLTMPDYNTDDTSQFIKDKDFFLAHLCD